MFVIKEDIFAGFKRIILLNEQSGDYFSVIPARGAIIQDLCLSKNNKKYNIIDGVDELELPDNNKFKSSILFPFPGRIEDGKYSFENKNYQLEINDIQLNNSLHGIVYNEIFEVTDIISTSSKISIELNFQNEIINAGFPFYFNINLLYSLSSSGEFNVTMSVLNFGEINFPFGIGWHPYFKLGEHIDQLKLTLPSNKYDDLNNRNLPSGKILSLDGFIEEGTLIKNKEFDNGFKIDEKNHLASTKIYSQEENVGLEIIQDVSEGFLYTQIYTPHHRKSIAIEPQTCGANVLNTKKHIKILSPDQEWSGNISVKLF